MILIVYILLIESHLVYIVPIQTWEKRYFEYWARKELVFSTLSACKAVEESLKVHSWKLRSPEKIFIEGGGRGLYFISCR